MTWPDVLLPTAALANSQSRISRSQAETSGIQRKGGFLSTPLPRWPQLSIIFDTQLANTPRAPSPAALHPATLVATAQVIPCFAVTRQFMSPSLAPGARLSSLPIFAVMLSGCTTVGTPIIGPPDLTSEISPFVRKKKRTKFYQILACSVTGIRWNSGTLLICRPARDSNVNLEVQLFESLRYLPPPAA